MCQFLGYPVYKMKNNNKSAARTKYILKYNEAFIPLSTFVVVFSFVCMSCGDNV